MGRTAISLAQPAKAAKVEITAIKALGLNLKSKDPITSWLGYLNNTLNPLLDVRLIVGYILGSYDAPSKLFYPEMFTIGSTDYVCGSYLYRSTPAKGHVDSANLLSYLISVGSVVTLDILAYVYMEEPLPTYSVNWGSGQRIIGMPIIDFKVLEPYALQVYTGALTVNP